MKFDLSILADDLKTAAATARAAEALGAAGLWTSETRHNPFLPLTLAASVTSRLELGTAVAIAFPRSPMVTAQVAWDLARQSDGRFILGLGTQIRAHITKRFGVPWTAPVPRLREYIEALRAIWRSFQTGEPLRYTGSLYRFTLMTPFFSPGPNASPHIPIYVAGVNPGLCRLAGELADGFHVHPFHSARYLSESIRPVIAAASASAGRPEQAVALSSSVFVVTGSTPDEVRENALAVRAQIAFYGSTPSYRPVLTLHGWDDLHERLNALSREGKWLEMSALISDEMLHTFAVVAPADELAEAVHARYNGLLNRVSYYLPFTPDDAAMPLWRRAASILNTSD